MKFLMSFYTSLPCFKWTLLCVAAVRLFDCPRWLLLVQFERSIPVSSFGDSVESSGLLAAEPIRARRDWAGCRSAGTTWAVTQCLQCRRQPADPVWPPPPKTDADGLSEWPQQAGLRHVVSVKMQLRAAIRRAECSGISCGRMGCMWRGAL